MSKKKDLEKQKKIKNLKARAEEVKKSAGIKQAQAIAKTTEARDTQTEIQQTKRYKNAPLSDSPLNIKDGILSRGAFSINSKKSDEEEKKRKSKGRN